MVKRDRKTKASATTYRAHVARLRKLWPRTGEKPTIELLLWITGCLYEFPRDAYLWHMLGLVVEIARRDEFCPYELSLECFHMAARCNRTWAEPYVEIGFLLDVYANDFDGAATAFRRAIRNGATAEAYAGLARVLAEQGRKSAAMRLLAKEKCPYWRSAQVRTMRREILDNEWNPPVPAPSRRVDSKQRQRRERLRKGRSILRSILKLAGVGAN